MEWEGIQEERGLREVDGGEGGERDRTRTRGAERRMEGGTPESLVWVGLTFQNGPGHEGGSP